MDQQRFMVAIQSERWLVFVLAVWAGISMIGWAVAACSRSEDAHPEPSRIERAEGARERVPAVSHCILGGLSFGTACALLANVVPPTAAYALLCLVLAGRSIVDQIAEERAPRRRAALLGRSRRVDPVLLIWMALAAASVMFLIPWVLARADRFAAIVVTGCAATMVAVAWRIASAPPLLLGDDLEAEQIVDREMRAIRTGNACFFAIAASAVFLSFSGSAAASIMIVASIGLFTWARLYAHRLSRTPLAS